MKGVVFTELLDMVEAKFGLEVADAIVQASGIPGGCAYTAVGTYDWRELATLVQALSAHTGTPVPELLRAYGRHLFGRFVVAYPQFFADVPTAFDFLENVEAYIHPEVRKLYPDAELPHFQSERTAGGLELRYRSQRPFAEFARGLIDGCLEYFAVDAEVVVDGGGGDCTFRIVARKGVRCPSPN